MSIRDNKSNFLAAYHRLKFSKTTEHIREAVNVERRCLALKYVAAKTTDSDESAAVLLRKGLEDYRKLIDDNGYWQDLVSQVSKSSNDPSKWESKLDDPQIALNFVKPLLCQTDNASRCKEKVISDKHVKDIVGMWKNQGTSVRARKISTKDSNNASQSRYIGKQIVKENHESRETNASHPSLNRGYRSSNVHSKPNFPNPIHEVRTVPAYSSNEWRQVQDEYKLPGPERDQTNARLREEERETAKKTSNAFTTARRELSVQQTRTNRVGQKTLGGKRSVNAPFVCPLRAEKEKMAQRNGDIEEGADNSEDSQDERLKNVDPKMIELIKNEIMDLKTTVTWNDVAGLEYVKKIIKEVVVFPMLRPDIFTGLRRPPKGILLFGPPGTGKTLIGKCIASQSHSTFFSISASSLTSKWIGDGEKMVRALFAVARVHQPAVVFVDEIDSLLSQRSETEHESSRRLKTEFLVQLDGVATGDEDRVLIVGATNRPHELDEAARRRLVKRLYIPLPEHEARIQIINNLLSSVAHDLTEDDIIDIASRSQGYSGADMTNLCKEASMGPIRSIPFDQLGDIRKEEVRRVTICDFNEALTNVRPSVSQLDLNVYVEWDRTYGSGTAQKCNVR